jgi:hypothetical protein
MNSNEETRTRNTTDIINAGSEITGGALAGATNGFLMSGLSGAFAGAVAGGSAPLIKRAIIRIADDISERFISEREKIRIGGVIIYASKKIQERLAAGEMLRNDGFFELPSTGLPACTEIPIMERPPAEEVIEGFLLAVQREHEESKLPFIGNLLANIFFDSTIDKAQANWLIKFAQRISFRQMCILSLYMQSKIKINEMKRKCAFNPQRYSNEKMEMLIREAVELGLFFKGIELSFDVPGAPVASLYDLWHSDHVHVNGLGRDLYRLMDLRKIDDGKLEDIVSLIYNEGSEIY